MNIKENDWKIWLIRSTFGIEVDDRDKIAGTPDRGLPTNFCKFAKMFIFSVIILPFVWQAHVLAFLKKDTADKAMWWGLLLQFVGMTAAAGLCFPADIPGHTPGPFHMVYEYFKVEPGFQSLVFIFIASPFAIIFIAIVIFLCALVIFAAIWLFEQIKDYISFKALKKSASNAFRPNRETKNLVSLYFKGLKEKYCIKINYIKETDPNELDETGFLKN